MIFSEVQIELERELGGKKMILPDCQRVGEDGALVMVRVSDVFRIHGETNGERKEDIFLKL